MYLFDLQIKYDMTLTLNVQEIVWPGGETKKPRGYIVPTHLKVYLFLHMVDKGVNFKFLNI